MHDSSRLKVGRCKPRSALKNVPHANELILHKELDFEGILRRVLILFPIDPGTAPEVLLLVGSSVLPDEWKDALVLQLYYTRQP